MCARSDRDIEPLICAACVLYCRRRKGGFLLTDTPVLQTTDLRCERDDRELFAGLSWCASAGEIWQIAGPNGAGKTTLIRILAGLHGFYDGALCWPRWQQSEADPREKLLYLGHKAGLRDELTPLENLRWWQSLHPSQGRSQQIPDSQVLSTHHSDPQRVNPMTALARVGLAGYESVPCASLSAGQKRRVALSLLWLMDKPVWLLDEPFTALDADGVVLVEERLKQHAAEGGLVIYSSHHRFDDAVRHVRLGQGTVEIV